MSRQKWISLAGIAFDVILVTGDAYVDHPSFGMAVIGHIEAQGYRQALFLPDWRDEALPGAGLALTLYFWGDCHNMDSMINRYTADRRLRHDDAYTAGDLGGKRPDRAVTVYAQKCREAYSNAPVVVGGIEASLRRLAHYDYWSESVKRSVLIDSTADMLLYGNAERALVDLTHRLARGEKLKDITDLRGTAFLRRSIPSGWREIDSTQVDQPGPLAERKTPMSPRNPEIWMMPRPFASVLKIPICAPAVR